MKICFFGMGGVGGYFGSLITKALLGEHDIFFVARGAHKDAICASGLTLKKSGGEEIIIVTPTFCTDRVEDLPLCDIFILSVKGYDLEQAAHEIAKISNEKTVVLPLLNGVDIYERIRTHYPKGIVLPACVYVGTHIESPGIIYQKGGSGKISMGKDPLYPDFYPENLVEVFRKAQLNFSWEDNVATAIWTKYMYIAAYGLVTAAYDKSLGEVLKDPALSSQMLAIMKEIEAIAKALQIPLAEDVVAYSYGRAREFSYETTTSFQRDVKGKGRTNEGDLFGGTIIRLGEELKIPTPICREVYAKLLAV